MADVHRDVERCNHRTVGVVDGYGDGPQADLELLVDEGEPGGSDALQGGPKLDRVADRLRGEVAQLGGIEIGVLLRGGKPGEQDSAHGGRVCREPGPDVDGDGHDAAGRDSRHVNDVAVVED